MMHDREKSHSAIVAAKPTNKAGSVSAAEPVEPRAGTKRNAGEQGTHRTQGRVGVTQALDRVRQAARQMYDLPSILEVRTGCLVWGDFCQGGAPRVLSIFLSLSFFVRPGQPVSSSRPAPSNEPARAGAVKDGA